jgi:hypothetical protein
MGLRDQTVAIALQPKIDLSVYSRPPYLEKLGSSENIGADRRPEEVDREIGSDGHWFKPENGEAGIPEGEIGQREERGTRNIPARSESVSLMGPAGDRPALP